MPDRNGITRTGGDPSGAKAAGAPSVDLRRIFVTPDSFRVYGLRYQAHDEVRQGRHERLKTDQYTDRIINIFDINNELEHPLEFHMISSSLLLTDIKEHFTSRERQDLVDIIQELANNLDYLMFTTSEVNRTKFLAVVEHRNDFLKNYRQGSGSTRGLVSYLREQESELRDEATKKIWNRKATRNISKLTDAHFEHVIDGLYGHDRKSATALAENLHDWRIDMDLK